MYIYKALGNRLNEWPSEWTAAGGQMTQVRERSHEGDPDEGGEDKEKVQSREERSVGDLESQLVVWQAG